MASCKGFQVFSFPPRTVQRFSVFLQGLCKGFQFQFSVFLQGFLTMVASEAEVNGQAGGIRGVKSIAGLA